MNKYNYSKSKSTMHSIVYTLSIIIGLAIFLSSSFVYAQNRKRVPTEKVLEYSLLSLQKSAQDIAKKNEWLYSENILFRKNIDFLQKELKALRNQKIRADQGLLSIEDFEDDYLPSSLSIKDKKLAKLHDDVLFLHKEQMKLEEKIKAKKRNKIAIQKEINALRKEINQIKTNKDSTEFPKKYSIDPKEEAALLGSLEKTANNIQLLEGRIAELRKLHGKPLKHIDDLKSRQNILRQKHTILEDEYKVALAEEKKLNFEIKNIKKINKQNLRLLDEEIKGLKRQGRHLEKTLVRAKNKLRGKNLKLDQESLEIEEESLYDNLNAVQKENKALKKELAELDLVVKNKKN